MNIRTVGSNLDNCRISYIKHGSLGKEGQLIWAHLRLLRMSIRRGLTEDMTSHPIFLNAIAFIDNVDLTS